MNREQTNAGSVDEFGDTTLPLLDTSQHSTINTVYHDYHTVLCGSCGWSVRVPITCGNRFCDVCNGRSRHRTYTRLQSLIDKHPKRKGMRLRFVTLTIPNVTNAEEGFRDLIQSFKRLRQRNYWKKAVDGGAYVVELKRSASGWHVHLHMLIYSYYIPSPLLSGLWAKVSPGFIVNIRLVKHNRCAGYLTKYLSKGAIPLEQQEEASKALKGSRLFQPFGTWQGIYNALPKPKPVCPKCGKRDFHIMELVNRYADCAPPEYASGLAPVGGY